MNTDNKDFRFAGNSLKTLSTSDHLPTRQAVADQYSAPQTDFGSLLSVLEVHSLGNLVHLFHKEQS